MTGALMFIFPVMAAEVVKHFFPKLVELHNYTPANSAQQKLCNWSTLNRQGRLLVLGTDSNKNNASLILPRYPTPESLGTGRECDTWSSQLVTITQERENAETDGLSLKPVI